MSSRQKTRRREVEHAKQFPLLPYEKPILAASRGPGAQPPPNRRHGYRRRRLWTHWAHQRKGGCERCWPFMAVEMVCYQRRWVRGRVLISGQIRGYTSLDEYLNGAHPVSRLVLTHGNAALQPQRLQQPLQIVLHIPHQQVGRRRLCTRHQPMNRG